MRKDYVDKKWNRHEKKSSLKSLTYRVGLLLYFRYVVGVVTQKLRRLHRLRFLHNIHDRRDHLHINRDIFKQLSKLAYRN